MLTNDFLPSAENPKGTPCVSNSQYCRPGP